MGSHMSGTIAHGLYQEYDRREQTDEAQPMEQLILLGLQVLVPVIKNLVAGHGVSEEQLAAILDFEQKALEYAQQAAALSPLLQATTGGDVAAALARANANHGT